MFFNSLDFFIFFIITSSLYFILSSLKHRMILLLVASYYFYMQWNWSYIFLIVGMTLLHFYAAKYIDLTNSKIKRKVILFSSIFLSLLLLFFFKYYDFINTSILTTLNLLSIDYHYNSLDLLLPVGISFYTFQALSYTIDVYQRKYNYEKSLIDFSLYVAFFPQLVAGPIERASNLLSQFKKKQSFSLERIVDGSKLILWGLFKKVVISEQLAIYVNQIYANPEVHSGPTLIMATYFFAFQIYLDFSAYTDMAIGMAKILGFDFKRNFNLPYLATSITDFWRRWHISLTTWFTDYIYIPLGGSRVKYARWMLNIFIVFLISGLWHGAAWTFVIWGLLHAFYYFVQITSKRIHTKYQIVYNIPKIISVPFKVFLTFNVVAIAWVFFRAESLSDAILVFHNIIFNFNGRLFMGSFQVQTYLALLLLLIFYIVQILQYHGYVSLYFSKSKFNVVIRWISYLAMIFGLTLFGISDTTFIYFRF